MVTKRLGGIAILGGSDSAMTGNRIEVVVLSFGRVTPAILQAARFRSNVQLFPRRWQRYRHPGLDAYKHFLPRKLLDIEDITNYQPD